MGVNYSLLIYIQAVQSLGEDKQQNRIIQRLFYMKQKITILAVLTIVLATPNLASAYDFSAVSPSGHTLYYNIVNGSAEVTTPSSFYYGYEMPSGNLIIPSNASDGTTSYIVTAIGEFAFANCGNIVSVTVPSTVRTVRSEAFYGCTKLATVLLPDSLETIESGAFAFCRRLVDFVLPPSVSNIGDDAFIEVNNVVYTGDSNLFIAWCGCFVGGAKMINGYTENGIVYFDSTKTEVRGYQGVISDLVIPSTVLYINKSAFSGCDSIVTITLPSSIVSISDEAFYNVYPQAVYYLGTMTDWCNINFGWMYDSNPASHSTLYINNVAVTDIVIPEGVTTIKQNTFNGIGTSVVFSSTVTTISDEAFVGSKITNLTIPATVQNVGAGAFRECYYLQNVVFEGANTTIGGEAFYYCRNLKSVILPDSLSIINNYTFYECSSLDSLRIPSNLYMVEGDSYSGAFYGCDSLKTIFYNADSCTTPLFVRHSYMFDHQAPTRTIHIGENVRYIPSSAFSSFDQLDTIYANPQTAPTLGSNAFDSVAMSDYDIFIPCGVYSDYQNTWGNYSYQEPVVDIDIDINVNEGERGMCEFEYDRYGNEVWCDSSAHIIATSNYGYHFYAWSDGDTNSSRVLIANHDSVLTANFMKNIYTIDAVSDNIDRGTIVGERLVEYLDSTTITAIPNYGYHFTVWNDGNADNPRTIVATKDSLFTASFDFNQYTITLIADSDIRGSVIGGGSYNYLSGQTISATSNYGYHFIAWNDGDTNNPRTVILTQDTAFTALFAKNTYTITAISSDDIKGAVTGSASIEYHDTVLIEAIPEYGYHFTAWNDGNSDNPRTIVVTKDTIFTASFDYNQYTITITADSDIHGSVVGGGSYNYFSEQTVSATANYGYHFTAWNDGDTNNPRNITLTQDTVLMALFAKNQYTLTLHSNDASQGSVVGDGVFSYLDTVDIEATAVDHYHFLQWSDGNTYNPRQYVVTGNDTLIAFFAIDTHYVSVESCNIAFGNVTGGGDFEYGTPATVTATAYSGYQFVRWSNGDTHNPYTFAVLQDTALVAFFEEETLGVADVNMDDVKVYSAGGQIIVESGQRYEIGIYDIIGHNVDGGCKVRFDVPASGIYMVKIGSNQAVKVLVVK